MNEIERNKADVCKYLAEGDTISKACERSGVEVRLIKTWRKRYPEFDDACNLAYDCGTDKIEDEAKRRAVEGVVEEIFRGDVVVGEKTIYSDTLMIKLLEARRPDKFRSRVSVDSRNLNANVEITPSRFEELAKKIAMEI